MSDEEFEPIIESGIEYTGVSLFRTALQSASSARTPTTRFTPASPRFSQTKLPSTPEKLEPKSYSASVSRDVPENERKPTPRVPILHSKSLTYPGNINFPLDSAPTPRPLRSERWSGGGSSPGAPRKEVLSAGRTSNVHTLGYTSTPSPWRGVRSGEVGNSRAPVKQPVSAQYRLSNDYIHGDGSSPASKSAPVRHLSFSRCSFKRMSADIRKLRELARQGCWKRVIERVKGAQKRGLLSTLDQEIAYGTYHLLALMKLQDYRAAAHEIAAFGDLDSPQYRFENHPELYPNKSGSMVPWSLRCMHAELPHREGKTGETLHRLYELLNHCDAQIDVLQAEYSLNMASTTCSEPLKSTLTSNDDEQTEESAAASDIQVLEGLLSTWRKRREIVSFSIVSHHLYEQQFLVALQWLDKLMAKSPADPYLQTKAILIQLQLGDVVGAQKTFSAVEALVSSTPESSKLQDLLGRTRGVLYMAQGEFSKAIEEFDAVLARNSDDIVCANNKALCLLYNRQLTDAVDTLENAIFKGPKRLTSEAVVANVCSMYEVVSFSSAAAKRSLRTWIKDHGPDDFEPSSFRL